MNKIIAWWNKQDPSIKALIIIGIICAVGIIVRWDYVVGGIKKGFNFYSVDAD